MSLAIEEQAHDPIVKVVSCYVSDIHLMPKPDHYVLTFVLMASRKEGRQDLDQRGSSITFKYRADMGCGEKRKFPVGRMPSRTRRTGCGIAFFNYRGCPPARVFECLGHSHKRIKAGPLLYFPRI